jgi:threonine aldolase
VPYLPTPGLVTHLDIDDDGVVRIIEAFKAFFAA